MTGRAHGIKPNSFIMMILHSKITADTVMLVPMWLAHIINKIVNVWYQTSPHKEDSEGVSDGYQ